jgi:hypothetical protein
MVLKMPIQKGSLAWMYFKYCIFINNVAKHHTEVFTKSCDLLLADT